VRNVRGRRRDRDRLRARARSIVVAAGTLAMLAVAMPAVALPSAKADQTAGFDAKVRAVFKAGNAIWVGGAFENRVAVDPGPAVAISALDPVTGGQAPGITPPQLGGDNPIVYDFSLSPGGVLYAAGRFSYQDGGQTWRNLIGIDPSSGALVSRFSTPTAFTVFATSDRILLGGDKLRAYSLTGQEISSFQPLVPKVNGSIRGHDTPARFRDIGVADDGAGFAVGQFDFINDEVQKVAVKFDVTTGAVADWDVAGIATNSAAFGIELELVGPTLYVAAGGSDFAAAYAVSDGAQIWKTDTSGSAQAIALYDANHVIVGGHFQWVAYGSATQCGSNSNPNTECLNQPRLVAMSATTGAADDTWRPDVCCKYNGVWALWVDGTRLHIGGEFTKIGGVTQKFYARFSDTSSDPGSGIGLFSDGFEGGFANWTSFKGMSVQSTTVHGGSFAAQNDASAAWALKRLAADHQDIYARVWLNVQDQQDTFQAIRLRRDDGTNVVVVLVLANGKLRVKNAVAGGAATSQVTYHTGWNDLQVRALVAGSSSEIQLWLDGSLIAQMNPTSLGSTGIARIEIGHRGTGKSYTAVYDDVVVDTSFVA
jgi:hypothetical protein